MKRGRRFFLKWTRTLHIYVTLLGLVLLLFFAVTGFMLNHEEWFGLSEEQEQGMEGAVPVAILKPIDRLMVVERLRSDFGATGAVDSFDDSDAQTLRVVFKGPGRQTDATIQREDGQTSVTRRSRGVLARLTDLHRGKAVGAAWGLIIDSTCVLLTVISLTGLLLWSTLKTRRRLGVAALMFSVTVYLAVYLLLVP